MRYARNLHICFVQYFQYNPGRFLVQIDYIHTSFPCLPAGIECSSIRLAVIIGNHATSMLQHEVIAS